MRAGRYSWWRKFAKTSRTGGWLFTSSRWQNLPLQDCIRDGPNTNTTLPIKLSQPRTTSWFCQSHSTTYATYKRNPLVQGPFPVRSPDMILEGAISWCCCVLPRRACLLLSIKHPSHNAIFVGQRKALPKARSIRNDHTT